MSAGQVARACGLLHGTSTTTTHSREPFLSSAPLRPHYLQALCIPPTHTHTHSLPDGVSLVCMRVCVSACWTHTQEREGERERIVVVFPTTRTHTHLVVCPHFTRKAGGWYLFTNKRLSGAACWLAAAYSLPLSLSRCLHTYICAITYIHT